MKNILTLFFIGCLATVLHGQIYVKANATGANDGTSWVNAYTSLGSALAVSTSGSQVWVAAGTYKPDRDSLGNLTPSDNRNKTFALKNGVALYGGFVGTETTLAQRNVTTNLAILSGDIGVVGTQSDNVYSILVARNLSTATRIDGVTVTLAKGSLSGSALDMVNCRMNLTIANCIFSNNNAGLDSGAAIGCDINSGLTIEKTIFDKNGAFEYGGAIFCTGGSSDLSLNLTDCIFKSNTAHSGGAVATGLRTTAINCDFTQNYAFGSYVNILGSRIADGGNGGGIYTDTDLTLTNCNFYSGTALTSESTFVVQGGAICQTEGNLTLNQCGFVSNSAYASSSNTFAIGGGIYTEGSGSCLIDGCLFYNNYAEAQTVAGGGGLYCKDKTLVCTNSVFYKNEAKNTNSSNSFAGGFTTSNSSGTMVTNCTFVKNTSGISGGMDITGNTSIKNTILWGNVSTSGSTSAQIDNSGTGTISYSLIQSGVPSTVTDGGNNLSSDPLFVNINSVGGADNNWPTADDGLALQTTSPAATKGTTIGAPTTDVLGVSRLNYNSMGAYQKTGIAQVPVTLKDFSGKAEPSQNLLTWTTATELNNLGFDIERSADAITFEKIGFVKAKGQNSTYDFADTDPLSISYYRLSQSVGSKHDTHRL
jgi:predicted outer membrane repeat protein